MNSDDKLVSKHINTELNKKFDEILQKPKSNIGPEDLKFLEVECLKPTTKNPKAVNPRSHKE